jgi:hypothetical protein
MFMGDPVRAIVPCAFASGWPFSTTAPSPSGCDGHTGRGMSVPFKNPLDKEDIPRDGDYASTWQHAR